MSETEQGKKSDGENKPRLEPKKKRLVAVIVVVLCAIPIMYLLTRLLDRDWSTLFREREFRGSVVEESTSFKFEEPDYEYDIFEDEEYLDKNRLISYTEGGVTRLMTDAPALYGVGPEFMARYFDAVINGDSETLNSLLSEDFIAENGEYGQFTMQKVYDISVERLSEAIVESGKYVGCKRYTYRVAYKIMNNNGTFRSDMESDAALPTVFELIDDGSGVLLNSISRYYYVK